jgi:hypothetical protein
MLAALIQKDEQHYARKSDLAYLARLDVTYFEKDGGLPWVNNVLAHMLGCAFTWLNYDLTRK